MSPELLHGFARGLAPVAFLRNITLLSINMKVIWRASLLKNCEQANQCNNSGETEEVSFFRPPLQLKVWGGPGGSGGSEKHIWKIFYRGDPEIGTPGTPRGSHGTKIFVEKFSLKKLLEFMLAGLGVIMVKK